MPGAAAVPAAVAGGAHSDAEAYAVTVVSVHSVALKPEILTTPQQSGVDVPGAGDHLVTCCLHALALQLGGQSLRADEQDLTVSAEAGRDLTPL